MRYSFKMKDSRVVMIQHVKDVWSFREAYDTSNFLLTSKEDVFNLKPIPETRIKAQTYWSLPYGEVMAFLYFLERNFDYCCLGKGIHVLKFNNIRISGCVVKNEVGEPFLDCSANVPKSILDDMLYMISEEYQNTK